MTYVSLMHVTELCNSSLLLLKQEVEFLEYYRTRDPGNKKIMTKIKCLRNLCHLTKALLEEVKTVSNEDKEMVRTFKKRLLTATAINATYIQ